ncbi:MAG TPA: sensor histidine kinase [Thermoanaerobaculia bacterium]|nr:sensor histidine kinase [Thermoanaerobaculia bacterium]
MTMRLIPKDKDLGWTPYAWTIYAVFFLIAPSVSRHTTPMEWAATAFGMAVFLALYFRGYWVRGRELLVIIAALTLLAMVYFPFNPGAGCFFIYAGSFAGRLGTTRQAIGAIAAIEILCIAQTWWAHISPFNAFWPMVFTILIGAINIHFVQVGRSNARLKLAQDEVEHLAKVAERERIARDLHDLLGHTLSLIVLKSELASKLAERDPQRAGAEIRDVERISRDALAQVRAAVTGYRSGGITAELDAANHALATAGIAADCRIEAVKLPASHEVVLALAIREASTNILRHAGAKHAAFQLRHRGDAVVLTVSDDGRGGSAPFGSGLAGMRERIASLGGTFARDGSLGTTLTITLPLPFEASLMQAGTPA